jgi:hypothetical protein
MVGDRLKLKNFETMNLKALLNLVVIGLALPSWSMQSQVFNYTDGDLVLDFSQGGANYDVEVDIGSLNSLTNAAQAAGGTVQISGTFYNATSQLLNIFPNVNSLSFSVFGLQFSQNGSIAANTSWLTQTQTGASPNTPPHDLTPSNQNALKSNELGALGLQIDDTSLAAKGILPWSAPPNTADPIYNTTTVVIIPTANVSSFTKLGTGTLLNGAVNHFRNITSGTFSTDGGTYVSDLFELDPGLGSSSSSVYRGYFTFNNDGTLYFSLPGPPNLPSTTITSVTVGGGTVTVKFNTVPGINYRLHYSTQLNISRGSWTVLPGSVSGTGATGTLTDTSATDSTRFYTVESY